MPEQNDAMQPFNICIIIVNWNAQEYLRKCLESVAAAVGSLAYEIIVVDNALSDASVTMLQREFPWAYVLPSITNLGFTQGQ